ncbi:ion channel [Nocardioides zeae]|uniref:Two pore domain potassium channel family protein n=1 Tax=Nocardioides zeae TaxID=1457234 RepID=A0A6P0HNJ1_9ACTN|nr:two pore domain potassium channel family protein [Nocardioides zeae]
MDEQHEARGEARVDAWERRVEVPLLGPALAFLVAWAWPVLDPRLDPDLRTLLRTVSWTVWGAFAIDFAIRMRLARDRRRYALRHWYDVALILLPLLRPLRVLRVLAFMRVLQRTAAGGLAGRATTYVLGTALISLFLGAVAVLDTEQDAPDANIRTFGDALWWATTTVTTVGYGDRYPVTFEGRLLAVVLMLVGIGAVGVVTAALAAWLLSHVREEQRGDRG